MFDKIEGPESEKPESKDLESKDLEHEESEESEESEEHEESEETDESEEHEESEESEYEPQAERDEELETWKDELRADFEDWLESVDAIPEPEEEAREEADHYSVYAELTALRNESRRGNRKSAEVFSQFGESLSQFQDEIKRLREQLIRLEAAQAGPGADLPRSHSLGLVEVLDRVHRLLAALERAPELGPVASYFARPLLVAWDSVRQGFSILATHVEKLLAHSGIERMQTLGLAFDPVCMVAVALVPSAECVANIVVEENSAGYRRRGEVLRPAEVKISKLITSVT